MKTQLRTLPLLAAITLLASCQGSSSSQSASGFSPSTMNITAGSVSMTGTRADGTRVSGSGRDFSEALRNATSAAPAPARPSTGSRKTAADLEAEQTIRTKIKQGKFIPGYSGGPVKYSTGGGVKTFQP